MQPAATVTFIVNLNYTLDLSAHERATPVWLLNSPHNALAAEMARSEGLNVTLVGANGSNPEDRFLNHVDTVDQHHNEHSQVVGYGELRVVGVELTSRIENYLPEFGFTHWTATPEGFVAKKRVRSLKACDA